MLKYLRESKMFMSVSREGKTVATIFLSGKNPTWQVYSISSSHAESNDLRAIADKLDELNGVHPK
ncbi:MAG: hypothetical protein K2P74_06860 [Nitrosomonas sp.]|nr:hypothetical protein [Nitrosomonas sp.]